MLTSQIKDRSDIEWIKRIFTINQDDNTLMWLRWRTVFIERPNSCILVVYKPEWHEFKQKEHKLPSGKYTRENILYILTELETT